MSARNTSCPLQRLMTSQIRGFNECAKPPPPFLKVRRLPHEQWVQLDENYAISNRGRWYSIRKSLILAQSANSSGYLRATTCVDGIIKHRLTHIKVIEIFGDCNGNRLPHGAESLRAYRLSIDHRDRNKHNNHQNNLEIVTHQENCLRKFIKKP